MTPKEIVTAAYAYLSEVASAQKISDVRVEELEPVEATASEPKSWNVVLSYDAVGEFPFERQREYKEFRISDAGGRVLWMKIKKV